MTSPSTATNGRVSTRERQRLGTRERLIDAAIDEIETRGLIGARIGRIAEHAGVTRPTLYAHFPRKEEFLLALAERSRRKMGERVAEQLAAVDGLDLVHRMIDILVDAARNDHPTLRREIFALYVREPALLDWSADPFYGFLVERIDAARASGQLNPDRSTDALVRIITSTILGFVAVENEPAEVRRAAAHDAIEGLLRSFA